MKCFAGGVLGAIFLLCISSTYTRNVQNGNLDESDLIVQTTSGFVKGGYGGVTLNNQKPVYLFRSIPFAEPPVGNLRFEPPVPVERWEGVRDVSEEGAICLQGSGDDGIIGSEDCLFLEVHTTELPREQKKLPVMVYIYGGAFFAGSPNFNQHTIDHLLDEGVIVAAIHYRLGIFGFLSTGDLVVPGNNGLKDQVLGLKWIKENIEKFGGDPDNITVFGQSAGGASIAYLLQTPQTEGLFNKAILHSGTSLCLWSLSRLGPDMAQAVAQSLNVNSGQSQALVDGLRTIDSAELQASYMSTMLTRFLTVNMREGLLFAPVIEPEHEGAILTGKSHDLLEKGNFHDVPIILGYTSLEARLDPIPDALRIILFTFDLQPSRLVPIDMNINSLIIRSIIGRQIKTEYFGNERISTSNLEVMKFISDDQFVRPIKESARLYAKKNPVYLYRFSHEGSLFGVAERTFSGVAHTEDLGYLFDFGFEGSAEDYLTRSRVVKLWTNFAKTSNPTPETDPLLQNIRWEPLTEQRRNYLDINRNLAPSVDPNIKSVSFWDNLFQTNGNPPYATY